MTARTMIRELADAGIALAANGDRLHYEARAGTVTPDVRATLTAHKAELLAELRRIAQTVPTAALREAAPRIVCDVRLSDHPGAWFTVLGRPGQRFDLIRHELSIQYRGRLLDVRQVAPSQARR